VGYFPYSSSLADKILTIVLSQSQESLTSQAGQKIRAQVWKEIVELLEKEYLEVARIVVYDHGGKVGRKNGWLC
jgi:flagellar basal body-associated protein FliL